MYQCRECQATSPKWVGKCSVCQAWNSFEIVHEITTKWKSFQSSQAKIEQAPQTLAEIQIQWSIQRQIFASNELNTVLGGWLVPGSLVLVSGEPGIGKSTLTLQMADWIASEALPVLVITGEESVQQVAGRAKRIGITNQYVSFLSEHRFESIAALLETTPSQVCILDSISVFSSQQMDASAGSTSLIRAMSEHFMHIAKRRSISLIIIGHVTKDGSISGPKILEHLVDVVLFLEGSKYESYRLLRSFKNRFGSADEVGIFKMTEIGFTDVSNPGGEFISQEDGLPLWASLWMTMEGSRPLVFEVESLITSSKFGYPKRSARGFPATKLDILLAVLTKYTPSKFDESDVYLNVASGLQLQEPGIDLAAAASLLSGKNKQSLGGCICIGEVSLTGGIKSVMGIQKRVEEAKKMGFTTIIIPKSSGITGKNITPLSHIKELQEFLSKRG